MRVRLKVDDKKWVIIITQTPGYEKKDRERQVIQEQLSEYVHNFDVRDWVLVTGDLNVKVSAVAVEGIMGTWGIQCYDWKW